ncbi:MAG: hypothetical protein KGZ60_03485 [Truepera sp.]|nr:hypothetical protein [Truepera sp.]
MLSNAGAKATGERWLQGRLERLSRHAGPTVLVGPECWGAPYLIDRLAADGYPLVWLELDSSCQDDTVGQGNLLAEAVARALGHPLFGYAMPYRYGLAILRRHLNVIGPFTFALSGAEHGLDLARELLSFQDSANRVVLHFRELPPDFTLSEGILRLGPETLKLTEDEAVALAGEQVPPEAVREALAASGGAYETFLLLLAERYGLLPPLRPSPQGPVPVGEKALEAEALVAVLVRQEKWLEALELALHHFAERVPELLKRGRVKLWVQGRSKRLYKLLTALPHEVRMHEAVLAFRLAAALDLGREAEVLPEATALLDREEAPELRALYAEAQYRLGDPVGYLAAAECAARAKRTPLTLYAYGQALGTTDPEAGLAHLQDALRLAETQGDLHWAVLTALGLAARLVTLGRYGEATNWAEWGLALYHREGLGQIGLRLSLVNEWAYARVLAGKTAGLEGPLQQAVEDLAEVRPALARLLRSTLGDVLLAEGRAQEALAVYESLWGLAKRRESFGALANMHVRALLEVGHSAEALELAERTLQLTEGLPLVYRRRAELAYGMALGFTRPTEALPIIERLIIQFETPLLAPQLAQAGLHLAQLQLALGDKDAAMETFKRIRPSLTGLGKGGLAYLAGPESAFRELVAILGQPQAPLALRFLGGREVRLAGRSLKLRRRFAEILVALALHPEGLEPRRLALEVYGERAVSTCRADLARLRKLLPVGSDPPHLACEVRADFLELRRLLEHNRVREALARYCGPLLPDSEAPVVVEQRAVLEESLRQAVLASGDVEALLILAERLENDLELWEAALAALPKSDPRRALVLAQVKRLKKEWGLA